MEAYKSPWKDAYHAFVKLHLQVKTHSDPYVRNVLSGLIPPDRKYATAEDHLTNGRMIANSLRDKTASGGILAAMALIDEQFKQELHLLFEAFKRRTTDDRGIFEDVYAVAFDLCTEFLVVWNQNGWWDHPLGVPELDRPLHIKLSDVQGPDSYLFSLGDFKVQTFYRGLKNDVYDQTAHIYRMAPGTDPEKEMQDRRHLINSFLSFVRASRPDIDKPDDILVAIAQHYYDISVPVLKTHLLDVTFDPFVALFFGTYGARPERDKHGVVYKLSVKELGSFTTKQGTLFGDLWMGFDPMITRLKRQRGAFISASMPDALSHLVPFEKKFYQRPGLFFEDEDKKITAEYLLPCDDECSQIVRLWNEAAAKPDEIYLTVDFPVPVQEFSKELIFTYLREHFASKAQVIRKHVIFLRLAEFHAIINSREYADRIWIVARSIRRLESTAEDILSDIREGRPVGDLFSYVFKNYFQYGDERIPLSEALNKMRHETPPDGEGTTSR